MRATSKRRAFYALIWNLAPAIAERAEEILAEEEAAPPAESAEPAEHAERVWWVQAADGRRWRL